MNTVFDIEEVKKILEQAEAVPFGNSAFQNRFLTDGHESPERRKRVVLLQLNSKVEALQHARFQRDRLAIDLDEISLKLEKSTGFEKRRLEIDFEEKQWGLKSQEKLIRDAIIEVSTFLTELKSLPNFTREEFEKAELVYWEKRLGGDAMNQLKCSGSISPDLLKEINKIGLSIEHTEHGLSLVRTRDILLEEKKDA